MTFHRVERIAGPRSYRVALFVRWVLLIWMVLNLALGTVVVGRPHDPPAGWFVFFWAVISAWGASLLVLGAGVALLKIQSKRERQSGFTWSRSDFRNLDQIDPKTYIVIRPRGTDLLTEAQFREVTERARAWASTNREST